MNLRGSSLLMIGLATATSLLISAPATVDVAPPPPPPVPAPPPPPDPLTADDLAARTSAVVVIIEGDRGWNGVAGTGIVLTSDGTVLTNHHVVSGATDLRATSPATGLIYDVDVIGYDNERDIAVLHLGSAQGLPVAPVVDIPPPVGAAVTAFGNSAGGGEIVATPGTVVALDRSVVVRDSANGTRHRLTGMVQTDAPIRPGDSGGPLVDAYGGVVGINTAGALDNADENRTDTAPQAYAVPIAEALSVANQVRDGASAGSVHVGPTPRLGVSVMTARSDGVNRGAEVLWVSLGTPADLAGLDIGDVLVSFAGEPVTSTRDLETLLLRHRPGDTVVVEWIGEDGNTGRADVVLDSGPAR